MKDEALKLLEDATRTCNNIDEQRALDALMREAQPAHCQWIWLSDADIAEVVDTTCQYTGSYEEYLIKKAERKIRSMNT